VSGLRRGLLDEFEGKVILQAVVFLPKQSARSPSNGVPCGGARRRIRPILNHSNLPRWKQDGEYAVPGSVYELQHGAPPKTGSTALSYNAALCDSWDTGTPRDQW